MDRIDKINRYFDRTHTDWNILDFLEENKEEPFQVLIHSYLNVRASGNLRSCLLLKATCRTDGTRSDYHLAKNWRYLRKLNMSNAITISTQGSARNVQDSMGKGNSDSYDDNKKNKATTPEQQIYPP
ncbi:6193_t:CDS:2 [Funneliformis mosseae]|uniref:6193_t:CDS:1 n=1 Tax=Funneliformis mosseae TaxID=27381 RepID=A0A9N9GCE5_FUNMO|nr:6193_t:CDS:2 [Funneliformis mosseae]